MMPGSDTTLATSANTCNAKTGKQGPLEKELEAAVASQAEEDYPDGGLAAWLNVLAGTATTFATFGYISSFGVFQGYYQVNQLANESPSSIAWIGSTQLFLIFFSGIFTGYLFDAGHFRPIVLTGSAFLLIGIFTTPECTKLWQFILAQGICGGLGCGFLFLPGAAVLSHWFKRKRALAYGIIACGSSIGGVLFPILLSRLFLQVGFKWAVRTAGFVVLACLAIINAFLKPRLPARKGGKILEFHHLKDPVYSLFCAAAFFIILGLYTPIFYISSYAQSKGVNEEMSFYILSILNAASLLGRLIPNLFADKLGPSNILWPASFISGILCFCWLGATSTGGIIAFAVVYGPASGSYVATIPAVIANITENMDEIGIRTSLAFGIVSFASLCGSPITGALHRNGDWVGPACFAGAVVLLGVAFGLCSRHLTAKRYGTWRV